MICLLLKILELNFDTSLNEPEKLNHWAAQLFSSWNLAEKTCREKLQENQIYTKFFYNQSHPNGHKIHAWKPKAYGKKTYG